MTWAWHQDVEDISAKFVLIALADHAGTTEQMPAHLQSCYPGQQRIAMMVGCSVKTVERALKRLEALGLVTRERRMTGDGYRTSDRYVLDLTATVSPPPEEDKLSSSGDNEGLTDNLSGDYLSPNRDAESGLVELRSTEPSRTLSVLCFTDFWAMYPRKDDKRAAILAFERAARRAPIEVIVAGAQRYRDDPNRDPAFTKLPATWLNRDSWENAPLPTQIRPPSSPPPPPPARELRRFS